MNMLLRLILAEPAYRALNQRYQRYADHNVSRFTAGLTCLLVCLGWIFLRLESTGWRAVRSNFRYWFPHIYPSRPRLADPVRYLLQGAWLLLFYPVEYRRPEKYYRFFARFESLTQRYRQYLKGLAARLSRLEPTIEASEEETRPVGRSRKALLWIMSLFAVTLAVLCISQPFDLQAQFIFVLLLWSIAMLIRNIPGRLPAMMMIVLSLTISSRYMWWRYSSTLNWDDPVSLVCGLILLAAETYAWLVLILGYFQTIWPLHRQPAPMPPDINEWPEVDILIPTYNEDLDVVKPTIYASLGIDWPKEKLHIYILDDGSRPEFKAFAEQVQVGYVTREKHDHAKAGNINNALKNHVSSEFVAIFDCDHVPTRSFLQLSMGWFIKEKKLGMLQTPHHFFSPDPFERNLGRFRKMPNEGTLFYGLVQDGNDMWDATFFCGSCAVLRRSVLDEIGGIAVETVTEDAHTSLKMHRRGYTSAYIRIPQAAGLATESLSAHIGQRIRWARGMVQIFRLDNPLLGKGLKLSQRLCYFNAMLHFLSGIPRLIFLTAPLAFLLLHAYIIYAPGLAIALYVLPHMIHASLTNSRIQGKYRHSFWGEIYETVLAWYIARPTTVALLNPHIGKFNVTAKGGLIEDSHFDWTISRPYLILILLNAIGLAAGLWRLFYGPENEIFTVLLNMVWVLYNLLILGGAVAVAIEAKQIRKNHRVEMSMPAAIATNDGHLYSCTLRDYSEEGIGIEMLHPDILKKSDQVSLLLKRGQQEFAFPIKVIYASQYRIGARLSQLSVEQHIDFIQCTFARADTWALWQDGFEEDKPLESLKDVLQLGFRGYQGLGDYTPPFFKPIFKTSTSLISWVLSITPHSVGTNPVNAGQKTIFQH